MEKLVQTLPPRAPPVPDRSRHPRLPCCSVKDARRNCWPRKLALFQPLAEKAAAYSRHVYEIASGTGAEFGKAFESQAAEAQRNSTWWTLLPRTPLPVPKLLWPCVQERRLCRQQRLRIRTKGREASQ